MIDLTQAETRTKLATKHERDQRERTKDLRNIISNKTKKQDNVQHKKGQISRKDNTYM